MPFVPSIVTGERLRIAVKISAMRPTGWRVLLLSLCAIVALLAIAEVLLGFAGPNSMSLIGQWGDTVGPSSRPFHLAVMSIDPGRAADRARLRPGDLIDIRANTPVERFWLFGQPPTGRPVTILVRRESQAQRATIVPLPVTAFRRIFVTPIWFGFIAIALFAAIIVWRRSANPQMRTFGILLITYGLWETTNQHYITSLSLWILVSAATINVLGTITVAYLAASAGSFASPLSSSRRVVQWICYVSIAVSIVVGLLKIAGLAMLFADPIAIGSITAALPFAVALLAAAVCTILAIDATHGVERQRAIWSLVPGALLIFVGFGAEAIQGVAKSYEVAWSIYYVTAAVNILTPMALTYVALNRRLLDIGFVLNRTAVLAIISAIVIAAFVIIEWIANEWLNANHTTSAIVGMVAALALGLSMRYLHRFVDRFVDRVLFRQRYEDEAALRRLAHEAAFITDRTTLLERAILTVRASTRTDVSILLTDDDEGIVDENDPALVALRAWHRSVDLERFPTSALKGQFAFPMVARGRLVGALICGSKRDSEIYAPDEAEALQSLADGVANALSLFSQDGETLNDSLIVSIAELRAAIKELRDISSATARANSTPVS